MRPFIIKDLKMKFIKLSPLVCLLAIVLFSCDEDPEDVSIHPLSGNYTLTDFTVQLTGLSNTDTTFDFINPVNGVTSTLLTQNTIVANVTNYYSFNDPVPIFGELILTNDGYAQLSGALPVNIGTKCDPLIFITELGSTGEWSAGEADSAFSILMVVEQLDIDGFYSFDSTTNVLTVNYSVLNNMDTLGISVISFNDSLVAVAKVCLPVTTITERTMELIKQD